MESQTLFTDVNNAQVRVQKQYIEIKLTNERTYV